MNTSRTRIRGAVQNIAAAVAGGLTTRAVDGTAAETAVPVVPIISRTLPLVRRPALQDSDPTPHPALVRQAAVTAAVVSAREIVAAIKAAIAVEVVAAAAAAVSRAVRGRPVAVAEAVAHRAVASPVAAIPAVSREWAEVSAIRRPRLRLRR